MAVVNLPAAKRARANARRRTPEMIEAAARVFAERGFHGATTQDIADVLGIRQASLYYYFSSKEAALELVCLQGVAGFVETAKSIAKDTAAAGAADKVAQLIRAHLSPLGERGDFVRVFLNERQHLPAESRRRIGKWSRGYERLLEDTFKEGVRRGEFRADLDTRLATLGLLGMLNAVARWHANEEMPIDRIAEEFSTVVLSGVTAPPMRRRRRR
jgi:AcrR family transcriptional regulator